MPEPRPGPGLRARARASRPTASCLVSRAQPPRARASCPCLVRVPRARLLCSVPRADMPLCPTALSDCLALSCVALTASRSSKGSSCRSGSTGYFLLRYHVRHAGRLDITADHSGRSSGDVPWPQHAARTEVVLLDHGIDWSSRSRSAARQLGFGHRADPPSRGSPLPRWRVPAPRPGSGPTHHHRPGSSTATAGAFTTAMALLEIAGHRPLTTRRTA
jgi:hypothetical protein